jgi:hypothetical protein
MRFRQYALAIGLMLVVAALAVVFLGHTTGPESRAAAMSLDQRGAAPPPKLSPREFQDLSDEGKLAEHPIYLNVPQREPVYDPVMVVAGTRSPNLKGAALQACQKLAQVLNAAKIEPTPGRLAHFAWLNQKPYRLLGWGASVVEIEDVEGGVAVTLAVVPSFQYDGGSATSADYYLEKYAVVNGHVEFLEGADPPDAEAGISLTD